MKTEGTVTISIERYVELLAIENVIKEHHEEIMKNGGIYMKFLSTEISSNKYDLWAVTTKDEVIKALDKRNHDDHLLLTEQAEEIRALKKRLEKRWLSC